jgi:teichoic acid transport system ATP-binding protein
MKKNLAIQVQNLSKVYKLYNQPVDRLKEVLHPFKKKYSHELYALKDISFEVKKGETVGIIGNNGSGKSTLLKIITGVLFPTSGQVQVNGRVAALLELGAGFNPEYTGMENIYLQGSIMGFSRQEMEKKVDEIIGFAEIGEFIHQPVKVYSSGMFVRLAFAVNSCVNPEILIVDEALSVGDVFFQNKCYRKFKEIQLNQTSILFVSHDLGAVKQFCDRVLWIKEGRPVMFGKKDEVCAAYLNHQFDVFNEGQSNVVEGLMEKEIKNIKISRDEKKFPVLHIKNTCENKIADEAEIISFFVCNEQGEMITVLDVGNTYFFHIVAKINCDISDAIFGFVLEDVKGLVILADNTYMATEKVVAAKAGEVVEVIFSFSMPRIVQGEYLISPALARGNQENHVMLTWLHNVIKINIIRPGKNSSVLEIKSDIEIIRYDEKQIELSL